MESSCLLRSICCLPSCCILFIILVFSLLASNNLFLVPIRLFMEFSTFFMDSRSSCLNFCLISSTCLVGSKASSIFRSIKSPNFNMCFSWYLALRSCIYSLFSFIYLSKMDFFFLSCSCCFFYFFMSFSCSFILFERF